VLQAIFSRRKSACDEAYVLLGHFFHYVLLSQFFISPVLSTRSYHQHKWDQEDELLMEMRLIFKYLPFRSLFSQAIKTGHL